MGLNRNKKLSKIVKEVLEDTEIEIYVSAISFWKISLKYALRKLSLEGMKLEEFLGLTVQTGFKLISVLPDECAGFYQLNNIIHKDPFDRMLIWQALRHNYILITKDDSITQY